MPWFKMVPYWALLRPHRPLELQLHPPPFDTFCPPPPPPLTALIVSLCHGNHCIWVFSHVFLLKLLLLIIVCACGVSMCVRACVCVYAHSMCVQLRGQLLGFFFFSVFHCGVWDSNSREGLQDNSFLPAEPSHRNSGSGLFHLA